MKDARIIKLRVFAERDLRISSAALRLVLRIYSDRYCDPHYAASDVFTLPWTQVSHWLGLVDRDHCANILDSLVGNYLFDEGLRGCPPTRAFRLNLKYSPVALIKDGIIPSATKRKKPLPAYVKKGLAALRAVKNQ